MVPASNLAAFVVAAVLLIALPGPTVLFVLGRSLALGRRGGLLSVVGNALGMLPAIALVALGVGALVAQSVVVFTILKFAGAAYLVYLGVQAIRHRRDAAGAEGSVPRTVRGLVAEGFVVGATNPKTIAFFVAVLPQFVDPASGAVPGQLAQLGLVFVALAVVMDGAWALLAAQARQWFARSPRRAEHLGAAGGVMMIGLGGALALSGSKS